MAKPRVFVSSTYYDLKHVRAALGDFISRLGFESVMNEKGDIPYLHTTALDESCYIEVEKSDILVMIIGSRYGSQRSDEKKDAEDFYDKYNSVTRSEFQAAKLKNIPIYILIEKSVRSEYETYLRNKDSKDIEYAHVGSINVFEMVEEILNLTRNNATYSFENYGEIESWLRNQWSGLFKELLDRTATQEQLTSLTAQVEMLSETNQTIKRYMETILQKENTDQSRTVLSEESERLNQLEEYKKLNSSKLASVLMNRGYTPEYLVTTIKASNSVSEFVTSLKRAATMGLRTDKETTAVMVRDVLVSLEFMLKDRSEELKRDVNYMRSLFDLETVDWD